ncbi:MAG: M48 family metallopeptidase [Rhodospirillales bacterium]
MPLADGAVLPVGGRTLTVRHDAAERRGLRVDGDLLGRRRCRQRARASRRWLRDEARRAIEARTAAKAALLPRLPAAVSLRDTRSRWGSCSTQGRLSFSWRLILAPLPVLDYVVAHELAHLRHHGHGPAFWAAVDELSDQVRPARAWLRRHGSTLFRYG